MSASLLLQYVVIALAVAFSVGYVAKRQFPEGVRKLRIACATWLLRAERMEWLRLIGKWIAPTPRIASADCGGCNNCGTSAQTH